MTLSRRQLPFQDCLTQCTRLVYLPPARDPRSRGSVSQKDQSLNGAYIAWRHAFPGRWRLLWKEVGPTNQVRSLPAVDASDFADFRRRMSKVLVALKLRYALVKPGCGVRLNLRRMEPVHLHDYLGSKSGAIRYAPCNDGMRHANPHLDSHHRLHV